MTIAGKGEDKKQSKILFSFISGGIAGACSKTLIAPIERVKYLFIVTLNRHRLQTVPSAITPISQILRTS